MPVQLNSPSLATRFWTEEDANKECLLNYIRGAEWIVRQNPKGFWYAKAVDKATKKTLGYL